MVLIPSAACSPLAAKEKTAMMEECQRTLPWIVKSVALAALVCIAHAEDVTSSEVGRDEQRVGRQQTLGLSGLMCVWFLQLGSSLLSSETYARIQSSYHPSHGKLQTPRSGFLRTTQSRTLKNALWIPSRSKTRPPSLSTSTLGRSTWTQVACPLPLTHPLTLF